jgi:hypothetical protein
MKKIRIKWILKILCGLDVSTSGLDSEEGSCELGHKVGSVKGGKFIIRVTVSF